MILQEQVQGEFYEPGDSITLYQAFCTIFFTLFLTQQGTWKRQEQQWQTGSCKKDHPPVHGLHHHRLFMHPVPE